MIMLSIGRIGWEQKVWDQNPRKMIVTLDKVIYINRSILIVVTQPQFTKQNRFTFSQKKFSLKLATKAI
jgi:hypothetical protein